MWGSTLSSMLSCGSMVLDGQEASLCFIPGAGHTLMGYVVAGEVRGCSKNRGGSALLRLDLLNAIRHGKVIFVPVWGHGEGER